MKLKGKMCDLGSSAWRLKTTLCVLAITWAILLFVDPFQGGEGAPPKWWVAVNALSKFGLGLVLAYVVFRERWPYLRLHQSLQEVKQATDTGRADLALPWAIVFMGTALLMGIIYWATISSVVQW